MSLTEPAHFEFDGIDDEFSMKGLGFDFDELLTEEDVDNLVSAHHPGDNMDLTPNDFLNTQTFFDYDLKSSFECPRISAISTDLLGSPPFISFPEELQTTHPSSLCDEDVISSSDDFTADSFPTPSDDSFVTLALTSPPAATPQQQQLNFRRVLSKPLTTPVLNLVENSKSSNAMPSITISLLNGTSGSASSTMRNRQSCGVMSGRIKKKEPLVTSVRLKSSPSTSPVYPEDDGLPLSSSSSSSSGGGSNLSPHATGARLHTNSSSRGLSMSHNGTSLHLRPSTNGRNGYSLLDGAVQPASIKLEFCDMQDHDYYDNGDNITLNSSKSRPGMERPASSSSVISAAAQLLHGSLANHQSDLLPITEEELRVMSSEGYPIPTSYPLNKQEEKNLKKVRRKIKNKRSAQESRRKKKEYMERLEKHADSINQENLVLRRRLEEMERRLELTEVRNRQLMSRLCKSTAGVTSSSSMNSNGMYNQSGDDASEHKSATSHHGGSVHLTQRPYSPPSCSTSGPSGNSTKFYIMAFVLLFSVLFAGDPNLIRLGGGSSSSYYTPTSGFPSMTLLWGGRQQQDKGSLFHFSHGRWRARQDMFCPAGVRACHQTPLRGGKDAKPGRESQLMRPFIPETPVFGPDYGIKTPSVLLDVQHESGEETTIFTTSSQTSDQQEACSLMRFWMSLWQEEAASHESPTRMMNNTSSTTAYSEERRRRWDDIVPMASRFLTAWS